MKWKYKKIKRIELKKWLLGKYSKLYFIILILFLVAVVFALLSLNMIADEYNETQTNPTQEEITSKIPEETKPTIPNNLAYKIVINKKLNILFIYKRDLNQEYSFYKAMYCAINPNVDVALTKISSKQSWYALDKYSFGHYATILENGAVIHSAPYWSRDKNNLDYESYNTIGSEARRGSIYVKASDAKWIYENCGINIDVDIYDREENVEDISGFTIEEVTQLPKGAYYDPSDH